jgi:hypothetical protein
MYQPRGHNQASNIGRNLPIFPSLLREANRGAFLSLSLGWVVAHAPPSCAAPHPPAATAPHSAKPLTYSDAKVANRDIRIWRFVIENGY